MIYELLLLSDELSEALPELESELLPKLESPTTTLTNCPEYVSTCVQI